MAQYDGSIRIGTKIDTKGVQRGFTAIKGDIGKFSSNVQSGISTLNRHITSIGDKVKKMGAGIRREISSVKGSVDSLSDSFRKLGATIASVFAVRKISGFASSMTELGSDLEEVQNVVDVTFTTMSDKVNAFAKSAAKSAGLSETMAKKYAGTFGAMSKSFGFAEDAALGMSLTLTQLAGDVASFYNISQDEAYTKLKSVFTGETETLKELGVVMTENALNSYAMAKGISKTVNKMTEQEKVALRYQFVLEKLSGASGDFVRTQDSWANQTRILKLQIESLKATIGQGLINVLTPLLRMLNALLEKLRAVTNAFKSFTESFFGKSSSSGAGAGNKYVDTAESITDSLEDVSDAAQEAEKSLEGYLNPLDEINKYKTGKDDNLLSKLEDIDFGQLGDMNIGITITPEIDDSGLADKFSKLAEKIKSILQSLFNPLKEAWKREGRFVMDSWKHALDEVWKLIKDIGRDFLAVWQQDATVKIFQDILHIIGDIGLVVGNLARNFRLAWEENETGKRILEDIRDIIGVIVANIRHAADVTVEWSKNLNFSPLLTKVQGWIESLVPVFDNLSGIITDFYEKVILPLGKWTIEKGLPDLLQVFIDFNNKVDWEALRANIAEFWEHLEPFAETVGEGLIIFIERVSNALADFLNSQEFKDFLVMVENWMDSVTPADVADALETIAKSLIILKLALLGFSVIKAVTGVLTTIKSFLAIFGVGGAATSAASTIKTVSGSIGGLASALSGLALVGASYYGLSQLTGHLEEIASATGHSTDQARRLEERYAGASGKVTALKDAFDAAKNGMEGYGFAADNVTGSGVALEKAMEDIANGAILSDYHMAELQKRFSLTDEDIEMLRQEILDANPLLREFADNLGFENASPETLEDIAQGFRDIANGAGPAPLALQNMTKEAQNFFAKVMESESSLETYREKLANIGSVAENASEQLNLTGQSISEGLTKGMEEADVETASQNFFDRVVTAIKNIFGIHSPAENMKPLGENMILGVMEGFKENIRQFTAAVQSWFDESVKPWFAKEKWTGILKGIPEAFADKFSEAFSVVKDKIQPLIDWVLDKINWLKEKIGGISSSLGNTDSGGNYSLRSMNLARSIQTPVSYIPAPIAQTLKNADIPGYATGQVIPTSMKKHLAYLGDNNQETEVVSPLSTIRQALREEALSLGLGNSASNNQTVIAKLYLDGKQISEAVIKDGKVQQMSTGSNPFLLGST